MRPKTKSEVPIGTVLSDRYRISREVGRGGMAAVYEAEHIEIGKRVAVKVLDPSLAKNETVIERFHREARAAAAVESANICEVFDVGRLDDGRPYLVMELLDGMSLYEKMVQEHGQLKIVDAVRVLSQVGRGLARAHAAGIVHRDLKPENIFLHRTAEGEEVVKLLDFGLAKFHTPIAGVDERLTREGAIFGTPLYMSPEQVSGQGHADHRSDLWALGCIAFECLIGRPVWPADRGMAFIFAQIVTEPIPIPSKLRPDLPRSFDTWLQRALHRDPDARYQNAQQMVVDMAMSLGHDPSGLVSAPALLPAFQPSYPVIVTTRDPSHPPPTKTPLHRLNHHPHPTRSPINVPPCQRLSLSSAWPSCSSRGSLPRPSSGPALDPNPPRLRPAPLIPTPPHHPSLHRACLNPHPLRRRGPSCPRPASPFEKPSCSSPTTNWVRPSRCSSAPRNAPTTPR